MTPNHFPTDNRLRDDIGLRPLAEWSPPPPRITRTSKYFPTDDRLREDVGLPPLGAGDTDAIRPVYRSVTAPLVAAIRQIPIGAAGARDAFVTAVAAILRPRRHRRIIP